MKLATNSYVPLMTAVFIIAHIQFLKSGETSSIKYLQIFLITTLTSMPVFISVYFAKKHRGIKKGLIWASGFLFYPLLMIGFSDAFPWSSSITYTVDEFAIYIVLYLLANIHDLFRRILAFGVGKRIKNIFTLSHVILVALIFWSLLMSYIISATPTILGMTEDTITLNIDPAIVNVGQFFALLFQFFVLSTLIWSIYYVNSRFLIKDILARYGVYTFLCSLIVCILIITPIYSTIVASLALNSELHLFLSHSPSLFQKQNYQIILLVFVFFTPLILLFEKHQQAKKMQQLSKDKINSELKMLQQQVNPHFLFNTLNNIYGHSLSGSDKTPKLISNLSNMLRYTVYQGQKTKVSIADEIQYLKNFIELQTLRARDNLKLSVHWPDDIDNSLSISPLLLIIVFENAFKHSIEKTAKECSIIFDLKLENTQLRLNCKNTFVGSHQDLSSRGGFGLENLKKRLEMIYPGRHELRFGQSGEFWVVELAIELSE